MFYIEETGEVYIKYIVKINEKELLSIRKKIIDNCSEIRHYKEKIDGDYDYSFFYKNDIRNFKSKKVGTKEYFPDVYINVNEVEYDKYIHPKLAEYINRLLLGDAAAIKELKKYKGNTLVKAKIKSTEVEESNAKIIDYLKNYMKLNKNKKSDMNYYDEVMMCITLIEVDRINKEEVRNIEQLYNTSKVKRKKKYK